MSEELRGYPGGWKAEAILTEHAFSLELAACITHLFGKYNYEKVNDLGAGPGFYAQYLKQRGFEVFACDASEDIIYYSLCKVWEIDLSINNPDIPVREATLCLEVGEHIEPEHEATVLDNIANSATKKIIMSWAIPGQGGFGHVNCRENDYIIAQMEARGWKHNPDESDFLRARCSGCSWFENTLMVFDK